MGLDVGYPAKESYLWYNGDFPLYKAVINFPMYDYYCMVDYDALINYPLDALIDKMDSDQIEFVGYRLRGAPEPIARNVRGHFRNTNSLLPCILIASHRVVKYLYQTRRRIAEVYRDHKELGWPFIEGFLGAAITDRSDIRYADLGRFGDVSKYEFWPPRLYNEAMVDDSPGFLHPVLDPARYAHARVRRGGAEFFVADSQLRRDLTQVPPSIYVPALRAHFSAKGEEENLLRLREFIHSSGLQELDFPISLAPALAPVRQYRGL
jgi:hypothetical protein